MITLEEAKNYLRVGYGEDDKLILSLLDTAERLVMDTGRIDENGLEIHRDITRTAVLSALGYLYENRSNPDYHWLALSLRNILFSVREGKF